MDIGVVINHYEVVEHIGRGGLSDTGVGVVGYGSGDG